MNERSVLVVDDEPDIRSLLQEILEDEGYAVSSAASAAEARGAIEEARPDLVLLDIWMPDEDGVSLLRSWRSSGQLNFPVIMISGHGTIETAVEATRVGASDFIEKPLSLAKLLLTVEKALAETSHSQATLSQPELLPVLCGESEYMKNLRDRVTECATANTPVMIYGEPGSGRDVLARELHQRHFRAAAPFLHLRCDSLSVNNSPRELLGENRRGNIRPGYLEAANHGTLYLSDVEVMPMPGQQVLLDALQDGYFSRVDDTNRVSRINLDVRIIASTRLAAADGLRDAAVSASHRPAAEALTLFDNPDMFSQLLARRLTDTNLQLIPLREHREDIPELLEQLVEWHVNREGLNYRHFSLAAQNRLRNLDWPGNFAELKNLVQRVLILGGSAEVTVEEVNGLIGVDAAGLPNQSSEKDLIPLRHDLPLREARADFERRYLLRCLQENRGNIGDLAKHVGMERTHLYRKLRSLDIDLEKVRE